MLRPRGGLEGRSGPWRADVVDGAANAMIAIANDLSGLKRHSGKMKYWGGEANEFS